MTTINVIEEIIAQVNFKGMIDYPSQGQFIVTGIQAGPGRSRMVGYCVQVRKGCGQFGSNMVFLRHHDGSLVTHENQSYFSMSPEQELKARSIFSVLPEDENYEEGYLCCNKVQEIGFFVENSASSQSTEISPFSITIKSNSDNEHVVIV